MAATPLEALRYYQGDVSDNPEFNAYWQMFGDPPDDQSWWIGPDGQLTPQAQQWFQTAIAGGDAERDRQAAADDDGLLGLGPIGDMAALAAGGYFLGPLIGSAFSGAGAAAGAGLGDAALGGFYGGLGEGALAGAAGAGAAGGAMDMFGSVASPTGAGVGGTIFDSASQALLGGAGGLAGQVATTAGKTALSKILSGNGTADDWLSIAGQVAPAALSAWASNNRSNALEDIAARFEGYGAPSRARYEASYAPGFSMDKDPGFTDALNQTSKGVLHGLSTKGNPWGSPNALTQANKDIFSSFAYPALQNYRTGNAASGGLQSYASAAPQAAASAADSSIDPWVSVAQGAANVFNPPKTGTQTLSELLKALKGV